MASTLAPSSKLHDHHHLICTACGAIEEFEAPALAEVAARVARSRGLRVTRQALELYGVCRACGPRHSARASTGGTTP